MHSNILAHPEFMEKDEKSFKNILALSYRYLGDIDRSRDLFRFIVEHYLIPSRPPVEDGMTHRYHLIERGRLECKNGVLLDMAGEHDRARQQFAWASEDCLVDEDAPVRIADDADVASAHLWRGYALLVLGNDEESCDLLRRVAPHFNTAKKHGTDLQFRKVEYFLPKLLTPLCEYLRAPGDKAAEDAVKGRDDFLGSLKDFDDKLDGLLYCLHLAGRFPGAFKAGPAADAASAAARPQARQGIRPLEEGDEGPGSVIIVDRKTEFFDFFGPPEEVYVYADRVEKTGDFPAIRRLIEYFGLEEEMEPGDLIAECKKLLAQPGLGPFAAGKTEKILDVAMEARREGSTVKLMYQDRF